MFRPSRTCSSQSSAVATGWYMVSTTVQYRPPAGSRTQKAQNLRTPYPLRGPVNEVTVRVLEIAF